MEHMNKPVPLFVLSGFLGSGKTTLLTRAIDYYKAQGKLPAVIMNELGDVNLDGLLVDVQVPMTEILSGCICCSVRGDLGTAIMNLVAEQRPDVIFIESTGVANPIETLEGVTEASLLARVEMKGVVTVVDCRHLLELSRGGAGKTFRLMQDQIRCASVLLLNKTDLVTQDELAELERLIRSWNEYAEIVRTVKCEADMRLFDEAEHAEGPFSGMAALHDDDHVCTGDCDHASHGGAHDHEHGEAHDHEHVGAHDHEHGETNDHEHGEAHDHAHGEAHMHSDAHADSAHADRHHHTHDHVMVYTHYLAGPIDSEKFERFIAGLPASVYRGKGVLTFADTGNSRFLFQYAYREADFMKITPQGDVQDVVVLIGEHMPKEQLRKALEAL
ncbi:GTP-binding protein [Paenibacillus contaminans]|uniref:GTP-binding protein n=2 Tax=Paenibacillus contaminans TaxID=450362 RepID=A0A329MKB6_9BACL|nr:GTP-binding protein [Paenibacillus contaminans]